MPLVRIDVRKGKDGAYRQKIGHIVYDALVSIGETFPCARKFAQMVCGSDVPCNNFARTELQMRRPSSWRIQSGLILKI
jgi:hypothetical protein